MPMRLGRVATQRKLRPGVSTHMSKMVRRASVRVDNWAVVVICFGLHTAYLTEVL